MNGSPIKRVAVRREPSTPRKKIKHELLTPETTPEKPVSLKWETAPPINILDEARTLFEAPLTPTKTPISTEEPASANNDTIFFHGKALFQRGSKFRSIIGRSEEKQTITSKINQYISTHTCGALYVSGLPGTGKSALLSEILDDLSKKERSSRIAKINCMTIDKPEQTYSVIAKEFGYLSRRSSNDKSESYDLLQAEFERKDMSHILVLDELDRIVTTNQEVLFRIFEWACGTGTNLVVIGIANAIDLTDRFLPRLQAHKLKPEVVAFKPYTAQGITKIIDARLAQLDGPLMHPAAVRICAAKTAANSGDLRKAFDVCRRAIEIVEEESANKSDDNEENSGIVTTRHVAKVCQSVFGGVDARERLRTLTFQQQAVLCVILKAERSTNIANITVIHTFQEYEARCAKNPVINSLSYSEYVEVVNALESAGLVAITGMCGKKGLGSQGNLRKTRGGSGGSGGKSNEGYREEFGMRKIASRAQILDVISDLSDNDPLRSILLDN